MKTLLTFGVYDMLHIGHILLFKHAKELFPSEKCRLIVAVQDSQSVLKYKPSANMVYSTEERMFMVSAVRWVDEVVAYMMWMLIYKALVLTSLPRGQTNNMQVSRGQWHGA